MLFQFFKKNFRKDNLALGTAKDNAMDNPAHKRRAWSRKGVPNRDPDWADVLRYPRERTLTREQITDVIDNCKWSRGRAPYGYVSEQARRYGVSKTLISLMLRGKKLRLDYPEFQEKV